MLMDIVVRNNGLKNYKMVIINISLHYRGHKTPLIMFGDPNVKFLDKI